MDFEEETEYKKKLDEQNLSLQRQKVREIDKFANMDLVVRNQQKETWKKELEEFEKKKDRAFAGASEDAEEVAKAAKFAR